VAKDRIGKRKDATILYETTLHTHISKFETAVEVFVGDLSGDRGGGLELQYFGTGMFLVLLS
jgi:hypothetical protein